MRPVLWGAGQLAGALTAGFRRALHRPGDAQRAVAHRIARDHAATALGRHDGVSGPDDLHRVPPRTWEQLAPWLARQQDGEPAVVTPHRVLWCEPTSGSQGVRKAIPYTAPLREAFTRMFLIWVHDLLQGRPGLRRGRLFMSVSPRFTDPHDPEPDAHLGTDDDTGFLATWLQPVVRRFLVVDPALARDTTPERFRLDLGAALLAAEDLEVISVWNPSFLTVLLDHIATHRHHHLPHLSAPRRRALRRDPPDWRSLWPALDLVSCWTDAHAARGAAALGRVLPGVTVQGKGLLATEAPVTVPLLGAPDPVPLVDRILVELLDDDGTLHPLHTADVGRTYELVVSQRAGLVRYRIGDRVRVTGHHHATPTLRFAGRTGGVVDLVGEKLHPDVAARALAPIPGFATLVPRLSPRPGYVLLTEAAPHDLQALADGLEARLAEAHHYRLARQLGQLGPVQVWSGPALQEAVLRHTARGARLGDVKPRPLQPRPGDGWLETQRDVVRATAQVG